ncbi:MAG: AmmeMemoRadiSam system protein B [Armatimonadetes bacterium]|nr:AmmeMemoRadiSam system protein B [Armatimonadota bacterium]
MGAGGSVRRPVVAGRFYAGSKEGLLREIEECYRGRLGPGRLPAVNPAGPRRLVGLVSPHAGYMFSGQTAARGFAFMAEDGAPGTVVIIGPSHQLVGRVPAAVQTEGAWETPLGASPIDAEVAAAVVRHWDAIAVGTDFFWAEHSLEVQLPFLQHLYAERLKIVPILMVDQGAAAARAVGTAVGHALAGRDAVIVASTDLSHYVSPAAAAQQDQALIERITALDPDGLIALAQQPRMSMCGYGAVAAMLHAALLLGAKDAHVLGYSHSGMVQPMPEVVGYVSVAVVK